MIQQKISARAGEKRTGLWDESLQAEGSRERAFHKAFSISFFRLSSVDREMDSAFGFKTTTDIFILGNVVSLLKKKYVNLKNNQESMMLSGIFSTAEPHQIVTVSCRNNKGEYFNFSKLVQAHSHFKKQYNVLISEFILISNNTNCSKTEKSKYKYIYIISKNQ